MGIGPRDDKRFKDERIVANFSFLIPDLFRRVTLGASMVGKPLMQARIEFTCVPHVGQPTGLADAGY